MRKLIITLAALALIYVSAHAADVTNPTPQLKSKIITGTRDLTVATGSVAYTGMGFQPTSCIASGLVAASLTQYVNIIGIADVNRTANLIAIGNLVVQQGPNFMLFQDSAGTNQQLAAIASYDADGLTLSWTKTGTPTGTATFNILCYR